MVLKTTLAMSHFIPLTSIMHLLNSFMHTSRTQCFPDHQAFAHVVFSAENTLPLVICYLPSELRETLLQTQLRALPTSSLCTECSFHECRV